MKKSFTIFLITLGLQLATISLTAQNWTQFRGDSRDSRVSGFNAPSSWPTELVQKWKVQTGTGDATPVLSGNKIFLHTRQGNDEVILALDAVSGKELWRNAYPAQAVTGAAASHPGPRSTPALSEDKIVTFGVTGIVSCIDINSGKTIWKRENQSNAVPQFFTGMSPLISDGLCFIHAGAKDKGELLALDLKTGTEKWKWEGDGPSYASPSMMTIKGKKTLVTITEKSLIALDPTNGKVLWQYAALPAQRFYNSVSPYIDGTKIYLSGLGTGTKALEVTESNGQYSIKELWNNVEAGAKWNTAVLKDGYLYGFTDQRRIYAINASNGTTAWIDNATNSDFATLVDCGSVLIGLPSTGNLIVFKANPQAYTEIARYKVSETAVYSFPVVSGNNIYIKDAESLILYGLTK